MTQRRQTDTPPVTFHLTIEEANLIFKALGEMPFKEVYELIGKLNEQANTQLKPDNQQNHFNNGSGNLENLLDD